MVHAALGEIAPEDAEKLWVVQFKIVAQQTNDEAIDFKLSSRCACRMLQECRTMGITKRNRIYYGRQMMDFETLQNWLPGLTRYRFKAEVLLSPLLLPEECIFFNRLISNVLTKKKKRK